ncbi:MAG: DNA-directed RNA polymerase subunit beta, partial [Candidatus Shikimatogenerans sp. JK-2022]|nr:DNA-directed RNA polymerase subunit beta [Candidatus Shikimatogenerans bostrichidophilus]
LFIKKKKKKKIMVRKNNDYIITNIKKINYVDYSHNQILSLSAGLIPFLEHDDANRALMGSNMMRQAVPLLKLENPIVGTGLEKNVIEDYTLFIKSKYDGVVKYIDSSKIIIKHYYSKINKLINFNKKKKVYYLSKFKRTNQNTCINLKPIVNKGQKIKKNQLLCEGFSNKNGILSLGKNLLVAFMSWKGYNFEDAIIISKKVIKNDTFTSIHIDEYSLELRITKYGEEKFTNDLPNINKNRKNKLNKNGLIKVGTYVKPGDILIGKIIPKKKTYLTPEEKLLKSIFGEKYTNIKNASLKAHSSLYGVVIKTKIYSKNKINNFDKKKLKILNFKFKKKIKILNKILKKKINIIKKIKKIYLYKKIIKKLLLNYNIKKKIIINNYKKIKKKIISSYDLPNGILKIAKVYIAKKRKLKLGDKMSGRHGNKGVISKIVEEEDMPFLKNGQTIDIILNPLSVPSRMNIGQVLESILGYIGYKLNKNFDTPIFNGNTIKYINKYAKKAKVNNYNKIDLYDGQTGEKFNEKITVGVIYMFKLDHMVDDKIHARSIGPYSLITQQPLGGKSQFGGQRFGEMEVWALEAFGASNLLRELLTIKSDDIKGRIKTYESIIKGNNLPTPNIPESFNVLINELKGLCLKIDLN